MRPVLLCLISLLASACASYEWTFIEEFPADGVDRVFGTIERGSLSYRGSSEETITVEGTSIGTAMSRDKACERRQSNDWNVEVRSGGTLLVEATSELRNSRVDFEIDGPSVVDVELDLDRGDVWLEGISGTHDIVGDRIVARQVAGNVTMISESGGMDLDLWPDPVGAIALESDAGPVVLRLPYGLDYELEVIGDPSYDMFIADLGFFDDYYEAGSYYGVVGTGSVKVFVFVSGGSFELLEAW